MSEPQSVPLETAELAYRLRRDAKELNSGVAMSNWTMADICEALALLLEKTNEQERKKSS